MKKNRWSIAGLAGVMMLAFSACGSSSDATTGAAGSEADTTMSSVSSTSQVYKKSADDKEDTMKLLTDFLAKTFEDGNHVVTATMDGQDLYTENVSGTSNHIKYATQDTETWAFIDGDRKIYATSGSGMKAYMVGDDAYALGKDMVRTTLDAIEKADASETDKAGITFSANESGETVDGEKTATITVTVAKKDEGQIVLTAEAKDGLVQKLEMDSDIKRDGKAVKQKLTLTFTYGNAQVTIPDISGWEDATSSMTIQN